MAFGVEGAEELFSFAVGGAEEGGEHVGDSVVGCVFVS